MQRAHQFSLVRLMSQNKHSKILIKIKSKLDLIPQPFSLGVWSIMVLMLVIAPPATAAPTLSPGQGISSHVSTLSYDTGDQILSDDNNSYIHLNVDNYVTGWLDHGNLIGELSDAKMGFDNHDIEAMPPISDSYLTLVFPHPEWVDNAGDYSSDFHAINDKAQSWNFEIRAKPIGSTVFLSWEGDPALLQRSQLLEVATGKVILPSDPRWTAKGYPIVLKEAVQAYTWQVLASSQAED